METERVAQDVRSGFRRLDSGSIEQSADRDLNTVLGQRSLPTHPYVMIVAQA